MQLWFSLHQVDVGGAGRGLQRDWSAGARCEEAIDREQSQASCLQQSLWRFCSPWQEVFKRKHFFFSQSNNTHYTSIQTSLPLPQVVLRGWNVFLPFQELSLFSSSYLFRKQASKQLFLHNTSSPMQEEVSCMLPTSPYRIQMNIKGVAFLQNLCCPFTRVVSCKFWFTKCYSRPNACESQTASLMP